MTTFINGPAKGHHLMLTRSPIFLRVTEEEGKYDALDQQTDIPKRGEKLFAYRLKSSRGTCHVNFGRGRGGWYRISDYSFIANQPEDATMRSTLKWAEWCEKQVEGVPE